MATTIHAVLAGAYKGKALEARTLLTHASVDGGRTALCKRVKEWALSDEQLPGPPTCETCAKRAAALCPCDGDYCTDPTCNRPEHA